MSADDLTGQNTLTWLGNCYFKVIVLISLSQGQWLYCLYSSSILCRADLCACVNFPGWRKISYPAKSNQINFVSMCLLVLGFEHVALPRSEDERTSRSARQSRHCWRKALHGRWTARASFASPTCPRCCEMDNVGEGSWNHPFSSFSVSLCCSAIWGNPCNMTSF